MSAISQPHIDAGVSSPAVASPRINVAAFAYSTAAVLGLLTIWPCLDVLWQSWTQDPLKSIGMFVPPVCFVLILRAWRSIGWSSNGTWWGLALILANTALGWIQLHSVLLLVFSPRWTTVLPPASLPLMLYGAGVVLLLGGAKLFRAALFPIGLLWFANPVPRAFSVLVDLPLQTLSARIARSFAMHLGQPLTPDHLRLMFTPEFGMFIAPGCNGIRGSITMALIALIAGYVYRFRWYVNAAVVAGAVLLGYLFNVLRLCVLVLYYMVALHLPWLKNKAELGDYIIGAALFLLASFLLFTAIHNLRPTTPTAESAPTAAGVRSKFRYAQTAVLGLVACICGAVFVSSTSSVHVLTRTAAQRFPQRIGTYQLVRTWQERVETGAVVYQWAEYSGASGGPVVIGISPALSWHDPLICHTVRGEHPYWQGPLQLRTAAGTINFSSALYADGVAQVFEASTQCLGGDCSEFATSRTHFGFIYTRLDSGSLLRGPARSLPVVIRTEIPSPGSAPDVARKQLGTHIESFVAAVNLRELTRP